MREIKGGITAPLGFLAAGMHVGIKKPPLLDLALVASVREGPIAGVFTRNRVAAAPVLLDRRRLQRGPGVRSSSTAGTPTPAREPRASPMRKSWRPWRPDTSGRTLVACL